VSTEEEGRVKKITRRYLTSRSRVKMKKLRRCRRCLMEGFTSCMEIWTTLNARRTIFNSIKTNKVC
jgi:hypothetical protein